MRKLLIIFSVLCFGPTARALSAYGEGKISQELSDKIDSLFVIASSGEIKYQKMVQPAIDSIAAIGASAVPRLIEKYDTQDARERQTINNILVKIGKPATPYLIKALSLDNAEQVSRICNTMGEIKDSAAVSALIDISEHDDWRVRSESIGALGKIGDKTGAQAIIKLLSDTVEIVRKSAAVAAGLLAIEEALPVLTHMLGDDFYGARLCASEALAKFGDAAVAIINDSLSSRNILLGNLGCATLGKIGTDSAAASLLTQIRSEIPIRRAMAVEGLIIADRADICGEIELARENETDPIVLFYMNRFLEKYAGR
jgi:HEAT repeat protein